MRLSTATRAASKMAAKKHAKARATRCARAGRARKMAAVNAADAATAAPSASLSTLPPDIIHHINGYIPEQDWATRNALVRTTRRLHHELNYSLYSTAVDTGYRLEGLEFQEWAALDGKVSTLQRLISYSLCLPRDMESMLIRAVYGNQHECVRLLLAQGASLPARDQYGSPLLNFCRDAEMVMRLLATGAHIDINLSDDNWCTALHQASHEGRKEVVVALLSHGADPRKLNGHGRTARNLWAHWMYGPFPSCSCQKGIRRCVVHPRVLPGIRDW